MRRAATAAVVACMAATVASAQAEPKAPSFAVRLDQARTALQVDAGGLRGPGAAVLADAVGKARYVLLGEDPFSREIPRFAMAVCRLMARQGLQAYAVEIGPEAARVVNADLRRPDRPAALAAFLRAHPDAMAFQNGVDESDMAAQCAAAAGPRFQIWGLDQEFLGAPGYLIGQMRDARPGPAARAAIEPLAALARKATAAAVASGSPGDLLLFTVTDRQMADAAAAVARDGGKRVVELFDALAETRAIYLGQNTDPFASNARRGLLMKHMLARYLDAAPKPSRVLFKFGDVHVAKGINALGQRDLGNFVAERADGEGASSLHIAVYGAKGVHALYSGVGRQVRTEPFVMTEDPDYAWLKEPISTWSRAAAGDWMVVDLRALRARPPADMSPQWRDAVRQFDLLVIAPELTPSSLMGSANP